MQTIQEVIRSHDRKRLEGRYFYKHSPKLWEFSPDDTRTIEEVKNMIVIPCANPGRACSPGE